MTLRATLEALPDDYEVVIKSRYGPTTYPGTAGEFIDDDNRKIIKLEEFELISEVHLPGQNGYPLPADRCAYRKGDIGGHIDPPGDAALRGPVGEWLALIEPQTEAALSSLGAGLLAGLGAYLGRSYQLKVGRITHTPNIFAVQVGPTGTARKGTADGEIQRFLFELDGAFAMDNVASGFGSGEALIERVADATYKEDKLISGTEDQRLYVQESEFSKMLRIADRQGSILSDVIRLAFDCSRPLANAAKTSRKLKSSNHCISMFGGITPDELVKIFPALAAVSGTGNRYLWVWSDPSKLLPYGGADVDIAPIAEKVRMNVKALKSGYPVNYFELSDGARSWWETHYPTLRQASHVPETVRPMVTRISDQVSRIALIYAVTEGSPIVTEEHLEAGLAWVTHSIQTVQAVLGGLVRNEEAGRILTALRQHPGVPAKKSELWDLFSRNITATAMDAALDELEEAGLAYSWTATTEGGRPPILVMATTPERDVQKDLLRSYRVNTSPNDAQTIIRNSGPQNGKTPGQSIETKNEKRGFTRGHQESKHPNTKEVSPEWTLDTDELKDPW